MHQKYMKTNAFLMVLLLTFMASTVSADGFSIGVSGTRADTGFDEHCFDARDASVRARVELDPLRRTAARDDLLVDSDSD